MLNYLTLYKLVESSHLLICGVKECAKCVVAGALLHARSIGVTQAILFTRKNNVAVQSAYKAIGFVPTGEEYGLLLLHDAVAGR